MANNDKKKSVQVSAWSARLLTLSSRIAAFLATRLSRWLIILVCILLALYLVYRQAWLPVLGTAPLPPGVTERSPQLNAELLEVINSQRLERVEKERQLFNVSAFFKPLTGP